MVRPYTFKFFTILTFFSLVKASPVLIPQPKLHQPIHMRPMRSSVEGLNQEIEKLVLHPSAGPMHSCRQELEMVSFFQVFS